MTTEDEQKVIPLPVGPGDCTVHEEWIVHGSGGNASDQYRKTYVVAFRDARMIEYERKHGFHHSYNDAPDVLQQIRRGAI
jgi:ectoine hydroxylase-related dioxygenase (phytanoyl-CoA dioxygenase family)